ncbi:DUF6011 domain-containing protein [Fodinisporobacter ferrooxydans]|uniref:DUF6011 domain-containing protein n=1 Tax=Fodinisporobacter ferrooxydans TaxID=2901836 RepID=A0ABY4CNQ6_9BACL|nr:DUF6011 domain-containing protein [Alicyclobacillaceae bacterium MYW30-H2]
MKEYENCVICGRPLSGKRSRRLGTGPVCRKKGKQNLDKQLSIELSEEGKPVESATHQHACAS